MVVAWYHTTKPTYLAGMVWYGVVPPSEANFQFEGRLPNYGMVP